MKDTELHKKIKNRDTKAYDEIMNMYGKLVYKVVYGVINGVGSREDIEEITSDVFIQLWMHPHKFNPERGSLKTYLCLQARSRAIDRLRKIKKISNLPLEDDYVDDGFEEKLHQKYVMAEVYKHVALFKEPSKEIFILRFFYQLKPNEIALKLSLPVKAVSNYIFQSKKQLREKMKGVLDDY
ncbi:sigma-70 family RNA polymerase sigma factor [Acidaminobacter sp. JC074]|uniref:sigma-70 family RNA polymerase sigma factor n=1 Tax=Acidaminobacter sp. JC074 TaxID=2530199 RepID=UPI001F0FFBEE|nr:sigma-70 family RNA polymerase sigma factor [Acidaminobacter sp. JC074]MCH4887065.1 sigma-70 family RNA polymerase sigma factor [Acidaminobacter sp. JC074]